MEPSAAVRAAAGGGRLSPYPRALEQVSSVARALQRPSLVRVAPGANATRQRPLMARSPNAWPTMVVMTDDNPRYEDATLIVLNILTAWKSGRRLCPARPRHGHCPGDHQSIPANTC